MWAELSDVELMEKLAAEPESLPDIFAELFERYYNRLLHYVFRRTGDKELSEDVVGAAFSKALERIETFDSKRGRISTWLYAIVGNELKMHWRKRGNSGERVTLSLDARREEGFEPVDSGAVRVEDGYDEMFLRKTFHSLITGLTEREREVMYLFYFEDLSTIEIAEVVEASPGAVRTALSRGRDNLEPLLRQSKEISELIKNYYE